ncbi:hypothetical protein [Saliterribacillus persicus]|uniref:Zinc ribbon protein n=1 Tax=Saliterribacillus persicus TaxID=930114 RepID=A0A368XR37_9BACI|nr:hypothetical protein [Saliterribacillus persicus]RCW69616.1 hypothetical protein DFR57_1074 [Saliterribacillus persicus]
MIAVLYGFAVLVSLLGFIFGIFSGSLLLFFGFFLGGIIIATLFVALARVLERQELMIQILETWLMEKNRNNKETQKICPHCQSAHDEKLKSCPICGFRY